MGFKIFDFYNFAFGTSGTISGGGGLLINDSNQFCYSDLMYNSGMSFREENSYEDIYNEYIQQDFLHFLFYPEPTNE